MRRLALHLVVALLAFVAGSALAGLQKAPQKAPKLTASEIKVCLLKQNMCADKDLAKRLLAIDIEYTARCLVYVEDWEEYAAKRDSGWIDRCYEEWGEARRIAVEGE